MRTRFKAALALTFGAVLLMPGIAGAQAVGDRPGSQGEDYSRAAVAAVCEVPTNGTNDGGQLKLVVSDTPRFYATTEWTDLECASTTISVPRGKSGGFVVRVGGEVVCTEGADTTQWCQSQVVYGATNVVARPVGAEPDSFSWASSTTDSGDWDSGTYVRGFTLHCPNLGTVGLKEQVKAYGMSYATSSVCFWNVKAQVKNHAAGLSLRVDESHFEVHGIYYTP